MYEVYDEDGYPTDFFIDSNTDTYFNAYEVVFGEARRIARIRRWNNNVAPYENLDTGVMYDSIEWLCANAA